MFLGPNSGSVGTVTNKSLSKEEQPGGRDDYFPKDITERPEHPVPVPPPASYCCLSGHTQTSPSSLSKQKKAIPSPCTWFGVISALISHCYFVFPSSMLFMGEGCTFLCIEMGTYLWTCVHLCVRACGGRRMTLVIISLIFVPHSLRFLSDIQSSPIWL